MQQPKPEPAKRELSPEKTSAILEGAMQQFLEHGYSATSMDKVASAAGVSKATVYSHFQDKEELFKAIIHYMAEKHCMAVFNTPEPQIIPGDPKIVLRFLATTMLEITTRDQEFLSFVRLVIGESGRFPALSQAFVRHFDQRGGQMIAAYLASRSELQLLDPGLTARVFMGALVHLLITQEIMHGKEVIPIDRDRYVDNLIHLITAERTSQTPASVE